MAERYTNPRGDFASLYDKLQNEECNISCFGASVTAQKTGYPIYLDKKFSDFFNIQHKMFQNGFGGHAIECSVVLLNKYVVLNKPDLCFIEWTTRPVKFDDDSLVFKYLEAIIYQLRKINCEICFIYLGLDDQSEEAKIHNSETASAFIDLFEKVAIHNEIPSINIYKFLQDYKSFLQQKNQLEIYNRLFRDFVHTSEIGSNLYGELLFEFFLNVLRNKNTKNLKRTQTFLIPDNEYCQVKYLPISPDMFLNPSNVKVGDINSSEFGMCKFYEIDVDNEIRVKIAGCKMLNIWAVTGISAGIIEIRSSTGTFKHQIWDAYSHYDRVTSGTIYSDVKFTPNEEISIKLTNIAVDYSQCTRKIENPENIIKKLRIIGLSYL